MSKLPVISGRECIKVLEKKGFRFKRQVGSHIVLRRDDPFAQLGRPRSQRAGQGHLESDHPAGWNERGRVL